MLNFKGEYICSPNYEEGSCEYLNSTLLYQRLKEEIKDCEGPCDNDIARAERRGKVQAYEHVMAIMAGIWNSGERLYVKERVSRRAE